MQGDENMEIKKYKDTKKEQVESAEVGLNIIEEVKEIEYEDELMGIASSKNIMEKQEEFKSILEDPDEAAKQKVVDIAFTVAQIKEVGLNPNDPVVSNWVEQELGVNSNEFSEILNNSDTPEEVHKDVLELMEAPKEIIEEADKKIQKIFKPSRKKK